MHPTSGVGEEDQEDMEGEEKKERWIQHYSSAHKILLVGEGDFSFSACLATHFGSAVNMVATSLDTESEVLTKYYRAETHLETLKTLGCLVLHEVDVNEMNTHSILAQMKFDIIIFNFPHAGHFRLHETNLFLIMRHRNLVRAFFESASEMLNSGGEVYVAHRDDYPYKTWKLEDLALATGLDLKEKVKFQMENYPGYVNRRGGEIRGGQSFPLGDCHTFKFCVAQKMKNSNEAAEDKLYSEIITSTAADPFPVDIILDRVQHLYPY